MNLEQRAFTTHAASCQEINVCTRRGLQLDTCIEKIVHYITRYNLQLCIHSTQLSTAVQPQEAMQLVYLR